MRQAGLMGRAAQKHAFSDCFHGRDCQYDGNGTRMRPVTVVSYEVLQSGVRVLRGADGAGQGRGSTVTEECGSRGTSLKFCAQTGGVP